MLKRIVVLLLFVQVSFGQEYGNDIDTMKLCSSLQANNFGTDVEAERGLEKILSVIGASKRFVLQPCDNINNAVATAYKGIRYILYDRQFMNSISNGNNWGNLFILAHEVGHHINGHSLDLVLYAAEVVEPKSLALKRQQELEADEFAGFILSKLGGPITAANQAIINTSTNSDDSYSTHPSRDKRLDALKRGYFKASPSAPKEDNYLQLFKEGVNVYNKGDRKEALKIFDKVIDLKSNFLEAYMYAFLSAYSLNDFYRSISYKNKMIEQTPNHSNLYENRAKVFLEIKNFDNALKDINTAIELSESQNPNHFVTRSNIYLDQILDDIVSLENELTKKAINDLNFAIKINPNNAEALFNLAGIYGSVNEMDIACTYLTKSCNLGHKEACNLLSYCN